MAGLHPDHFRSDKPLLKKVASLGPGDFSPDITQNRIQSCDTPVSPRKLLKGAMAVYTVFSQLGFEAILADHRPVVPGQPCYVGWGLTDDRFPP